MKRIRKLLVAISLSSLFLGQALPSSAQHLVTPTYNLEQMVGGAERIFVGKVIGAREDYISAAGGNLPITAYTFEVDEVLKGSMGNTLTIRQVGHHSNPSSFIGQSVPEYKEGSVVMLFLHADSHYGLTSPVGLGQGTFLVKMDGPIKISVRNSWGNRGLLERSARIDAMFQAESPRFPHPLQTAKDALPYEGFRNLIIKLVQH